MSPSRKRAEMIPGSGTKPRCETRSDFLPGGSCAAAGAAASALSVARMAIVARRTRSGYRVLDRAEPLDLDPHDVPAAEEHRRVLPGPDARGRPGQDEVAGLQRAGLEQEVDDVAHAEDEVARRRVLAQVAVDPR